MQKSASIQQKSIYSLSTLSAALLLSLFCLSSAPAETALQRTTAVEMARQVSQAFSSRTLSALDSTPSHGPQQLKTHLKPYLNSFEVVITHSLGQTGNEQKSFNSLTEFEAWLSQREHDDGLPDRHSDALQRCQGGLCHFEQTGLLHNNLYLRSLAYVYLNGQPYLKRLYIVDGD
jgi:hypothetical protein